MAITVNAVHRRVQYTSSGSLGPYSFAFKVLASADIKVYVGSTLKTVTTHYTTSLNADGTGSVTFTSGNAPASSTIVTIESNQAIERTSDYTTGGDFKATSINDDLDRLAINDQQLETSMSRNIQLPVNVNRTTSGTGTSGPLEFPYDDTASNQANKYIVYDANGTALTTTGAVASIDGATDTDVTSPANGSVLVYSTSSSKWEDGVALAGDYVVTGSLTTDNVKINGTDIGHTDDTDLLSLADGALTVNGTLTVTGATSLSDVNLTNVGDVALDSISADGTEIDIVLTDNDAAALEIKEGSNAYLTFTTTNSGEKITLGKKLEAGSVEIEGSAFDIDGGDISAATISGSLTWNAAQDLNSQALTNVNIDSGTITGITDLAVADGGTGASTLGDGHVLLGSGTDAITALDVTAKGSILVGDGSGDPRALGVGSNTHVLTADSSEASGIKWAAAAADASGPGSSTDNAIARFDGTGGKTLQNSSVTISDANAIAGATSVDTEALLVKGQALQHIYIKFQNVSGTLKHNIFAEWLAVGAAGNFHAKITGASTTATATPTVDGSTDFATGVGVNGNGIILNTAAQTLADMIGVATVAYNSSGSAITSTLSMVSRDVNGTTRVRPEIYLYGSPAGAGWNINTTNLASSKYIVIHLLAALA
jgi:hypothetical protein